MKFNIFGFSERYYKAVTAFITIGVTIGCLVYYYHLEDKSNTFVAATVYAAFLFIVGLYLSSMTNNISNKLYERKNAYIMLKRLNEIFSISCMTSLDSYEDISFAIISFQVFTGRVKRDIGKSDKKKAIISTVPLDFMIEPQAHIDTDSSEEKHYIKQIGFNFEPKLQRIEDTYNSEYVKLKSSIQESINAFIAENKIELNIHGGFFELDLLATNYEDWCNEHIAQQSADKKEALIQYIYKTIADKHLEFSSLDEKKEHLVKYYKKCNKIIQRNLKRMTNTYGNRLEFTIKSKEDILIELEILSKKIGNLEETIYSKTSETIEISNDCCSTISEVRSDLEKLQENIIDEIQTNILMLEEDIGIEFDLKEKIKELLIRSKKDKKL